MSLYRRSFAMNKKCQAYCCNDAFSLCANPEKARRERAWASSSTIVAACRLGCFSKERYINRKEKAAQCHEGFALRLFEKIGRLHSAARHVYRTCCLSRKKFSCLVLEECIPSPPLKVYAADSPSAFAKPHFDFHPPSLFSMMLGRDPVDREQVDCCVIRNDLRLLWRI